jgi:hypothetical protein
LLDKIHYDPKVNPIVICSNYKEQHSFSCFTTYVQLNDHLNDYVEKYGNKYKSFHEIVTTRNRGCKLYFDIEVEGQNLQLFNEQYFINDLVTAIYYIYQKYTVELQLNKDFFWMTSHDIINQNNQMIINKLSYHFVIDNYKLRGNLELKQMKELIKNKLIPYNYRFIDLLIGVFIQKIIIFEC